MARRGDSVAGDGVFRMPKTQDEADHRLRHMADEAPSSVKRKTVPAAGKPKRASATTKVRKRRKKSAGDRAEPTSSAPHWTTQLLRKRNGDVYGCRANVATIVANECAGLLAFNEFTARVVKLRKSLGAKTFRPAPPLRRDGPWLDDDTALIQTWLEKEHEVIAETQVVRDAVRVEARRHAFHPIRDWLDAQTWDGRERADTWLIRHALVRDSRYARAVSRKWLISAVARVYQPGCQVDHVLVIEGKGRAGKTSLLRCLTPNEDWFVSIDADLGSKDVLQTIGDVWIVELGELSSLGRTDWERVKHFITNKADKYRRAYGHEVELQRRNIVLAGTTNQFSGYLRQADARFWPVRSDATMFDRVRLDDLVSERDQLWAEAVHLYRTGEPWHIVDDRILKDAVREQEARRASDPWEASIRSFVSKSTRREVGVSTGEVLTHLGFSARNVDRGHEMRVAGILHALDWERRRPRKMGSRAYRYYPNDL